jgi:hypothetical protein
MPPTDLAQHLARLHFHRSEERRRPVPFVVVRAPFRLAGAQRQQGRRPIQRLDLRLFVDTEDHRVLWWVEIQPDDVADLVDQQRIGREFERLRAMRLQSERVPNAMDTHRAHARGLREAARTPVRRAGCALSSVRVTMVSTCVSPIFRGAPGRGSSNNPSTPLSINR